MVTVWLLCGYCVVTVWLLCGYCVVTVRVLCWCCVGAAWVLSGVQDDHIFWCPPCLRLARPVLTGVLQSEPLVCHEAGGSWLPSSSHLLQFNVGGICAWCDRTRTAMQQHTLDWTYHRSREHTANTEFGEVKKGRGWNGAMVDSRREK